ncbi:protein FAM160B1-like [Limulus polyphemus]|uniref:Protein FAM160B1-like n=1 Tax=Limulus polyphemus TaxID=6850 RepID=A0ABM1BT66_LIMPO|nr:protein FAM160B1-like [Limulus polyphemus]
MFSRIACAVYNVMDALAPPLPLHEEFSHHWTAIKNFYTNKRSACQLPVELTDIPDHLNQMVCILEQEEGEGETGNGCPCMEYFLQQKILEAMCGLAKADSPTGFKQHVISFASRILSSVKFDLLPHASVWSAVQKLTMMCGEQLASPYEKEEMDFIFFLCNRLMEDPYLFNHFICDTSRRFPQKIRTRQSGSAHQVDLECSKHSTAEAEAPKIDVPLVQSLITFLNSPDHDISSKGNDCLVKCAAAFDEKTVNILVQQTDFCSKIVTFIVSQYHEVQKHCNLQDINDVDFFSVHTGENSGSDVQLSPGKRQILSFVRWVSFFDNLVGAQPQLGESLTMFFTDLFLKSEINAELSDLENNDKILFTTKLISLCIRSIASESLILSFGIFLVGNCKDPELPGCVGHFLKQLLVDRCHEAKLSSQVKLATLQLFEDLLQKPSKEVFESLVLSNLTGRRYYDYLFVEKHAHFSDDEVSCQRKSLYEEFDVSPGSSPVSRTFAPSSIHKILNCFLLLLPDELKSCEESEDSAYDVYIKDAHRQFQQCLLLCDDWNWPNDLCSEYEEVESEVSETSDSETEADATCSFFYEGSFLDMLFCKLENMLQQPYELNLQVTSLISRLALFPHPNLHEYLLNPLIPLVPTARSLFTVLLKLAEDIQIAVQDTQNLKKKLELTRKILLTDEEGCNSFEESNALEAIIVLEEFCKELAAIAFVKYHTSS